MICFIRKIWLFLQSFFIIGMILRHLILAGMLLIPAGALAADDSAMPSGGPAEVHPKIGSSWSGKGISVKLIGRKQQYNARETETWDTDIHSPKSVNIHPSGKKYYVNSLEGGTTVVYDFATGNKLKAIHHDIGSAHKDMWAPDSGLFPFRYTYRNPGVFTGKPVESTFSHGGRYLWIPYYRRSFDLNAQDPSAMAVIDTEKDEIVRMFETGPLPKMVAVSPDGRWLAVTHWGDNTVGLLDISLPNPSQWHYTACLTVDYKLNLNFSRTQKVDRDTGSGYCLRGTVFTPDNKYLLVGCMGGGGGIAVIDLKSGKYLGRALGMMSNLRHLVIRDGWLYCSINNAGYVQRISLDDFLAACQPLDGKTVKTVNVSGWVNCKVPAGARTIELSPDGKYIYVACNYSSCLAIVDAASMTLLGTLQADSYPVGLDVSKDGRYIFTTSQARGGGGNCVDIFEVTLSK